MPQSSAHSSVNSRHVGPNRNAMRRNKSYTRKTLVTDHDAYTYALRAAYLAYLLQPRQKRAQHVANTSRPIQRQHYSMNDMAKELGHLRDNKSARFPHGFMDVLSKRLTGVLHGKERMPEYHDPVVKRTFAAFLNELMNPTFKKSMEKDRRVEELLLIFFSRTTTELQKGRAPEDDGWKLMVDRHMALFLRLISTTLQSNNWQRDRPELLSKLKSLESKLLQHDKDLASADASSKASASGGQSIEVEVPRSYEVKDMPLVVRVCWTFSKPTAQAQNDINEKREEWTEQAALRDLKEYQSQMMLESGVTLTREDFDSDEAFEIWRKGEFSDLSQMIAAVVQSNPDLAKVSTGSAAGGPLSKSMTGLSSDTTASDAVRQPSSTSGTIDPSLMPDQPVDMSGLSLGEASPRDSGTGSVDSAGTEFTFLPADARAYYRQVLKIALAGDLQDSEQAEASAYDQPNPDLLSKESVDLLNEVALRWRVPYSSRMVLYLDVVREHYQHSNVSVDSLEAVLYSVKQAPPSPKKGPGKVNQVALSDRSKWPINDHALNQRILNALHESLLRDLLERFQACFDAKPPDIGRVLQVLHEHIYDNPISNHTPEDRDELTGSLAELARKRAKSKYDELLASHVPNEPTSWEFHNVIQLGKAVVAICQKMQKRYRGRMREVEGIQPFSIFVEQILPSFAKDAKAMTTRVMQVEQESGMEIPTADGFVLYGELVSIRRVHVETLPDKEFAFHIEGLLQDFVWRWIKTTDSKMIDWIDAAVAQDDFQVRQSTQEKEQGLPPTEEERHSQSPLDIYQMFNQSVDQIIQLEWDDDLQYARFMTAMSKSIGRAVARYCELLDGKFAKEMDRQTPEQEMAAQRTQKERWVAAAKDFYATGGKSGEKIEPFQFWPESFVKINNIEYATLQLDKLEHEINVDACAAVINEKDPPPPPSVRRREGNKFLFTIKIIEGEDLKAGDMNGLSDPYVVLGDEYQKRLAKTKIVYQSLNPRWDESIDILTGGPLNVIATVWDWDVLGDHDCLGRTSLKLDPSHFSDFLPREYWLDLDTQGRVLVRVSMEGERDDIQFYFAKAFRALKKTERDMTRKITDKLSAYIQQCLSRRTLRALLSQGTIGGVSISSVRGYFSKVAGTRGSMAASTPAAAPTFTQQDVQRTLQPLLDYFDDNFAIMKETLTESAMILVMTRLWKEVLATLEGLLVPPLSDKLSLQKPLSQQEVDIVYKWLQILFDFFHAMDETTGEPLGIPQDLLKSPKYHDLQNLAFFYFETTPQLIRTSEGMASMTAARQSESNARLNNRLSAPAHATPSMAPNALTHGRSKSIMASRNLGTLRKAKEAKRREAQADPSDDTIMRILRMRPEAERYLRDRARQKERLAAAAAAEAIVRQSLQGGRSGAAGVGGKGGRGGGFQGRRWDTIRE